MINMAKRTCRNRPQPDTGQWHNDRNALAVYKLNNRLTANAIQRCLSWFSKFNTLKRCPQLLLLKHQNKSGTNRITRMVCGNGGFSASSNAFELFGGFFMFWSDLDGFKFRKFVIMTSKKDDERNRPSHRPRRFMLAAMMIFFLSEFVDLMLEQPINERKNLKPKLGHLLRKSTDLERDKRIARQWRLLNKSLSLAGNSRRRKDFETLKKLFL